MNKPRRTIVIGDVHGCSDELRELLREVSATSQDRLISVGDLIGKGPDSRGVLDWAMKAKNLECVQGNHELRFLSYWKRGVVPNEKPYDLETFRQLGDNFEGYMRFIDSWPLAIPRKDYLVVHGGFDPRERSLKGQTPEQLANIRFLEGTQTPWYEEYKGRRLVVFGHWARKKPLVRGNAIGLDTGCVYGESLSAVVLPERRIVSVRARKVYQRKETWR